MPITIQVIIHLHTIHLIIQAIRAATLDTTRNTSKTFTLLIGLPRPELLHRPEAVDIPEVPLLATIPLLVDIRLKEVIIRQQLVGRLIIPQAANLIHHTTRIRPKLGKIFIDFPNKIFTLLYKRTFYFNLSLQHINSFNV